MESQNFSPTKLIFINAFSQHGINKTEETYTGIKNIIENFKHNGIDVNEFVWN